MARRFTINVRARYVLQRRIEALERLAYIRNNEFSDLVRTMFTDLYSECSEGSSFRCRFIPIFYHKGLVIPKETIPELAEEW